MAIINWTNLYREYKGFWVALKDDEVTVIASGKNLEETAEKAEKKGFSNPIFMNIPKKSLPFIG